MIRGTKPFNQCVAYICVNYYLYACLWCVQHSIFNLSLLNTALGSEAMLGAVTAHLEGGVAIIDLHSNHRSSQSNLQQVLEHNLSLLIKSHQQKVINELVVYECIWSHSNSNLSTALLSLKRHYIAAFLAAIIRKFYLILTFGNEKVWEMWQSLNSKQKENGRNVDIKIETRSLL